MYLLDGNFEVLLDAVDVLLGDEGGEGGLVVDQAAGVRRRPVLGRGVNLKINR